MRIVLINPSMGTYYEDAPVRAAITLSPPLNLAVLAGGLLQDGHSVEIWDLEAVPMDLESALARFSPDLVGITFRTPLFPEAKRIAALVRREAPEALLVAGGVHASTRPNETLQRGDFDIVVRGEGDVALREIASGVRQGLGMTTPRHAGADRPAIDNLDSLPMPAWHLFDLSQYQQPSLVARAAPVVDLESSRGCLAKCVYCTKGVFGSAYRMKSPERFVDEVEHARAAGFVGFNLVDDSFTTRTSRAKAICRELIRRDLRMPWTCTNGIRVANVDEEYFRLARGAGNWLVAFGFESGSDAVLKRIKKGATVRQAERAVAWARNVDMTILGYFMVGLPGETQRTIEETAQFAASLDIDFAKFSITMPLPGTPLYDEWSPGIRDPEQTDFSIHSPGVQLFDHPDFTWPELEAHTRAAYRTFYGRPSYMARRLARSLRGGQFRREGRYALSMVLPNAMETFARR